MTDEQLRNLLNKRIYKVSQCITAYSTEEYESQMLHIINRVAENILSEYMVDFNLSVYVRFNYKELKTLNIKKRVNPHKWRSIMLYFSVPKFKLPIVPMPQPIENNVEGFKPFYSNYMNKFNTSINFL